MYTCPTCCLFHPNMLWQSALWSQLALPSLCRAHTLHRSVSPQTRRLSCCQWPLLHFFSARNDWPATECPSTLSPLITCHTPLREHAVPRVCTSQPCIGSPCAATLEQALPHTSSAAPHNATAGACRVAAHSSTLCSMSAMCIQCTLSLRPASISCQSHFSLVWRAVSACHPRVPL